MTVKEKILETNPDILNDELVYKYCPSDFGEKDHCVYVNRNFDCEACWNYESSEELQEQPTDTPTQPQILDSGKRREFETGAVRDMQEGKGRFDLLPWAAIMEVAKHCENGSKKYGEHNADGYGIPTHSFADSALRHMAKYLDGWTDENHIVAAAWNVLMLIEMQINHKNCVDTPFRNHLDKYKKGDK